VDDPAKPTSQRLELFILVSQAVQHAHQKGIIRRDLKPSNIREGGWIVSSGNTIKRSPSREEHSGTAGTESCQGTGL
jgi:hypothetical protein